MKTTIKNLSNESLEQEIAKVYVEAYREVPGVMVNEEKHPWLGLLWQEFDERFEAGTIDRDSDYTSEDED